ncbi:MAG: glycoside hydrolase family 2 TIM barrel-domain containing protein [Ignavibacteriaceae bacterium]|jgi:beta-mannosidase
MPVALKNILLNGAWNYLTDPEEKYSCSEIVTRFLKNKQQNKINVPSNWECEGLHNFSGSIWFVKQFKVNIPSVENELSILQFNGVDYFADVWLNGISLGRHEGYFQKFAFDVTDSLIRNGKNLLLVKVTSPKEIPGEVWPLKKKLIKGIFNHHDCRPGGWSLEYGQDQNTGGIWNNVELLLGDKIYVENVKITSRLQSGRNKAKIAVTVSYQNNFTHQLKSKIEIEVKDNGKKILQKEFSIHIKPKQNSFTYTFDIDKPKLWFSWDTGKPALYQLEISSELFNAKKETFGIKEVHLDKEQNFYLNGKKLFLRGTNIIPTQFLSEFSQTKIQKLVKAIKEANINIVRIHAHVNRKELYDEFDKQGILLWQDFPLQWTYDASPTFTKNAVSQIKDMARQFHNHPSIAFWCCHNEPGEQIKTLDPLLFDAVLSEDKTRIVRLASNYEEHPYDGWYWGNKEHYAATPMGPLVTEFGAQALPQLSSLKMFLSEKSIRKYTWKDWEYHNFQFDQTFNIAKIDRGKNIDEFIKSSQHYQADLLATATEFYRRKKNDGITGIFQFMFVDCWPSITWSIVDFYGKKKAGYFALQQAFKPLLLSVRLRQDTYLPEAKFNADVWVINDLHKSFNHCSLSFIWKEKVLLEIKNFSLSENDNKLFFWELLTFNLPKEMKIGKNSINVLLKSQNKLLDERMLDFMIVVKK